VRALLLLPFLWQFAETSGQSARRLDFEFGLSPAYVAFEPLGKDNLVGSKVDLGVTLDASVNWNFLKDSSAIGLGGGVFQWGDRTLFPVYFQLRFDLSSLYKDQSKVSSFLHRSSFEGRVGTMIGPLETTNGPLRPEVLYGISLLYRSSKGARPSLYVGIQMDMMTWRGPYQYQENNEWQDRKPLVFTIGPVVKLRL
jgi:hypothetical protein